MIFRVDYDRLAALLLPTFMRRPLIYGVLRAALTPLVGLYDRFLMRREEHNYRLGHNGQVCYLRQCLNDHFRSAHGAEFDIVTVVREGRWLYALTEDGGKGLPVAVSEECEGVPVLYGDEWLNVAQNEFVVMVPQDLYDTQLAAIRGLVDQYKLVSKRAVYVPKSV